MPLLTTTSQPTTEQPLQLYRIELTRQKNNRHKQKPQSGKKEKKEIPLICSHCSTPITSSSQAVRVLGLHEHVFFNPAGIAFEIRCYRQATGCLVQGNLTAEFSWFDDYSWQFATCGNCLAQLGWFFVSAKRKNSFFGLITSKVI